MSTHPEKPFIKPDCHAGLPICSEWDLIKEAVINNQVIIVTGETGSGKSTQLPKICIAAGRGANKRIACTQPRRIAAVTLASRVAQELGPAGKGTVGYRVRFKDRTSKDTRIKFLTDGMLLAEMQKDRLFREYDTIIIDEAHERTLNIDFLLGAIRGIIKRRSDLHIIITSATMDTRKFSRAFHNAPVINVQGRGFPVDVFYAPPSEDEKDLSVPELAVKAVEDADALLDRGDILVFLPTEQEIRESVKILRGRHGDRMEVLPMYGRLSAKDQARIFRPAGKRKVVISTNVAETSITVPGIVSVIDSGLARIPSYNPRSGTKGLPVSRISMSSARQRAGRAGRVEPGICIRLYSEEDFLDREEYTPPEILRSNLAEVILRLASMGLGDVKRFPFIDPPSPQAIKDGIRTLRETGAFSGRNRLTPTGRLMARIPLDPRISRIIVEAKKRGCLYEAMVTAAAMSIQDVRERPAEKQGKADAAHALFKDKASDFFSILNIWHSFYEKLRQGASRAEMKKFCCRSFISYPRMLEWQDILRQIERVLVENRFMKKGIKPSERPEKDGDKRFKYSRGIRDALHISILSGFLSHIALKKEGYEYMGTRGREVFIFPGSTLFKRQPKWLVSGEMVKTSRLYARLVTEIRPEWAEELGGNLCSRSYSEPAWQKKRGEATAIERVTLLGLPIVEGRRVSLKKYDISMARELFITEGLTEDALKNDFPFMKANRELIASAMDMENRMRRPGIVASPEVISAFYHRAIAALEKACKMVICDEASLKNALKKHGKDTMLRLSSDLIVNSRPAEDELSMFPGHITVSGHEIPLEYSFSPGRNSDGVTAIINESIIKDMDQDNFSWLVPGLLPDRLEFMLKALPGSMRKLIVPVPETVRMLMERYESEGGNPPVFRKWLSETILAIRGVNIPPSRWITEKELPDFLRMRFRIMDSRGKTLLSGRDIMNLKQELFDRVPEIDDTSPAIVEARKRFEMAAVNLGNYPEHPEVITLTPQDGHHSDTPLFPALVKEGEKVALRLLASKNDAEEKTATGISQLILLSSQDNLRHIEKKILPSRFNKAHYAFSGGRKKLHDKCMKMICKFSSSPPALPPPADDIKEKALSFRKGIIQDAENALEHVAACLDMFIKISGDINRLYEKRRRINARGNIYADMENELKRLVPGDFPASISPNRLIHIERYLKALSLRLARADADIKRDIAKAERVAPFSIKFQEIVNKVKKRANLLPWREKKEIMEELEHTEMMMEEFRVSVFAPEIRTAFPVSEKKMSQQMEKMKEYLSMIIRD